MPRPKTSQLAKVERQKSLVARLRKIAAEEETAGAKEIAADFRRQADAIEAGVLPTDEQQKDD